MRIIKMVLLLIVGVLVLFTILVAATPYINDWIAVQITKELQSAPLPAQTEIVETISTAGKLVGNGNGMQYFGAILIRSELAAEELEAYYAQYRTGRSDFLIEQQDDSRIAVLEHSSIEFKLWNSNEPMYVVYTWGDSDFFLRNLDLRAH